MSFTAILTGILVILFGLILAGLIVLAVLFNTMVKHRNRVKEAWSGIDVQLKRRRNLVPNLVETVKGYREHERSTLEDVVRARARAEGARSVGEAQEAEQSVTGNLKTIFALAESYPELKADASFRKLSEQLVEVEDQIQYARRYYNGSVRDYNTCIESFPANLAAGAFGFKGRPFFEIELATEKQNPEVNL
ncbi:MAG: LemA family protein [Verrucomicrobiales bacterium]